MIAPPISDRGRGGEADRRRLFGVGVAWLVFVVYGSLVPFEIRAVPPADAWEAFRDLPYRRLGAASRADWIANILLYMPIGFFWLGAFRPGPGSGPRLAAALAVWAAGTVLALGVEFTQVFFAPRTVSINDVAAETLGAGLGVVLWLSAGGRLLGLWRSAAAGGRSGVWAGLVLYLLGYVLVALFPYDVVLSADELAAKLAVASRDPLVAAGYLDGVRGVAKTALEVAAAVPLGVLVTWLLARPGRRLWLPVAIAGLVFGAVIEGAQLLLVSGVSQGLSVAARVLGALAGLALCRGLGGRSMHRWYRHAKLGAALALPVYLAALAGVNGWFRAEWLAIGEGLRRLPDVHFLPFYYHYFTTEQAALFSLLANAAMYAPLGIVLWAWRTPAARTEKAAGATLAAGLGGLAALAIEAGRLFMVGRRPDPTNILIAAAAAFLAHVTAAWVARWAGDSSRTERVPPPRSRRAASDGGGPATHRPSTTARSAALALGLAVLSASLLYPVAPVWLAAGLAAYAGVLWRFPSAWLIALPALLPVLDLAPWTGWFFFDEFDLFVLVTVAVGLWRLRPSVPGPIRPPAVALGLIAFFAASVAVSTVRGLVPLDPLDANAFAHYHSHYNALRVAKGFAWALALAPFLVRALAENPRAVRLFGAGMIAGLVALGVAVVWERYAFMSLFSDFSRDFRVSGMFSSMHTGGAHIDGYLAAAAPLAFAPLVVRRTLFTYLATAAASGLGAYAVLVTFSRGLYLAVVVSCLAAAAGLVLRFAGRRRRPRRLGAGAALGLAVLAVAAIVFQWGEVRYFGERLGRFIDRRGAAAMQAVGMSKAQIAAGFESRFDHWRDAVAMRDPGWAPAMLGMGLGRFPATYAERNAAGVALADYRYLSDGDNGFLRLTAGRPLYFGQRVRVKPDAKYVLSLDLRAASGKAALSAALCEKALLYSLRCTFIRFPAPGGGRTWQRREAVIETGSIGTPIRGSRGWTALLPGRSVELAFSAAGRGPAVEVDTIRLTDAAGRDLLVNGDFSQGHDRWFFETDEHLAWHVKNLWVATLFDQGWFGVLALNLLILYAAGRLLARAWRGDSTALVLLASMSGFLAVGLFGSLFDAPRLSLLFFLIVLLSVLPADGGRPFADGGQDSERRPYAPVGQAGSD